MAKVSLDKVSKVFEGNVIAVSGATLEISDGEFMVIVGPSGCGKTTTLRMIAGLEEITEGTIAIDERVVNDVPPKDRDIAMVFQNYALYPHMTVYKNLAYGLKMRRYPRGDIDARVREAAEILGIAPYLERKPKALSGGQRQRVAVGRAIVRKPKVFLFDEPLSNLDAKMRVQMRTEISKLHQRLQTTIIYVTHDQVEAMTMGSRIVVMKDGVVQQVAPPLELYRNPANQFVAGFIGSPPMNFFNGKIESKDSGLVFSEGSFSVKLDESQVSAVKPYVNKEIVFGVRPADMIHAARVPDADPGQCIQAPVEVVEPMGDEVYVYQNTGRHPFVAKVSDEDPVRVGDEFKVSLVMRKTHFFDPQDSRTIV